MGRLAGRWPESASLGREGVNTAAGVGGSGGPVGRRGGDGGGVPGLTGCACGGMLRSPGGVEGVTQERG